MPRRRALRLVLQGLLGLALGLPALSAAGASSALPAAPAAVDGSAARSQAVVGTIGATGPAPLEE
jgi:hypothetical protein